MSLQKTFYVQPAIRRWKDMFKSDFNIPVDTSDTKAIGCLFVFESVEDAHAECEDEPIEIITVERKND